eukprot:603743_1
MAQCDSLTLHIPSLSLPSARSKSSQPRTRKHLHTQSAVQTKSRTLTNELGTTSFPSTRKPRPKQPHNPHSHSKPPSFGPNHSNPNSAQIRRKCININRYSAQKPSKMHRKNMINVSINAEEVDSVYSIGPQMANSWANQ